MKTNQVMIRKMGDYNLTQRLSDGFFDATDLIKQHNKKSSSKKSMKDFRSRYDVNDYINLFKKEYKYEPYITKAGKNGNTWIEIGLLLLFCKWLSPEIYAQFMINFIDINKFVNAIESGDFFKVLRPSFKTYLIFDGDNYKIGRSRNVNERLKKLQGEYKKEMYLISTCNCDIEHELHKEYSYANINGEWFDLNKYDVKAIINQMEIMNEMINNPELI